MTQHRLSILPNTMTPPTFHLVSSFVTGSQFSGSPAAVVLFSEGDKRFDDAAWLDGLSTNFNLPATVYARPKSTGVILEYDLRWFANGVGQ
jgi:predicted PhzF superfamily epimerase YddE/YHI9